MTLSPTAQRVRVSAAVLAVGAASASVLVPGTSWAAPTSQPPTTSRVPAVPDPWGTKVALDANCISNGLEHRVAFILHADDTQYTRRYRIYLNHDSSDTVWHQIEAPGQDPPVSDWTRGQAGGYTIVFGWAPQPNERMWHRYAVGYEVMTTQGWSVPYFIEAAYMQDGTSVRQGCTTGT